MENVMPQTPTLTIKDTKPVKCEKCGCQIFEATLILRKIPGLLIGEKEDILKSIPVFTCKKCGHLNSDFVPVGLEDEFKEEDNKSGLII